MTRYMKLLLVAMAIPLLASCNFWEGSGNNIHNTNSGNVGIGTTAPGSKLSVNGLIESKSGGVKFPDGTVQTTAAGLLARNLITVRKKQFSVAPGHLAQSSVACQADEVVTGGGIRIIDDPKLNIWRDAPTDNASGWQYGVSNYGTSTRNGIVLAICMRVQ
jgi:hypothetical protein